MVGLFFGLSYAFGDHVANWIRNSEKVFTFVVVVAGVCVLMIWWLRRRPPGSADKANQPAETLV